MSTFVLNAYCPKDGKDEKYYKICKNAEKIQKAYGGDIQQIIDALIELKSIQKEVAPLLSKDAAFYNILPNTTNEQISYGWENNIQIITKEKEIQDPALDKFFHSIQYFIEENQCNDIIEACNELQERIKYDDIYMDLCFNNDFEEYYKEVETKVNTKAKNIKTVFKNYNQGKIDYDKFEQYIDIFVNVKNNVKDKSKRWGHYTNIKRATI